MFTLYPAKQIVTMNPSLPEATAILVNDGRIVEVGHIQTITPWLEAHPYQTDDRFADKVICPGFIDPHLHPTMAAVLLPMEFITAMRWKLPWGEVTPVTTEQAFSDRLAQLHAIKPEDDPLFVWGYHQLWHGSMSRHRINAISAKRPIVVWHRSFHELYMNDAALAMTDVKPEIARPGAQIDFERGHFFENGLGVAIQRLNPWIMAPDRLRYGLDRLKKVVHAGGHTSIGDLATGMFNLDMELSALKDQLNGDDVPFRTRLVAHAGVLSAGGRTWEQGLERALALTEHNTDKLQFAKHIKLFSDGAFFSQLAQLQSPGYIDGHHGEWLMAPEQLNEAVRAYWHAGFQIHVHVTGDLGLELAIDALQNAQNEKPRFNHGFTFEHFGFSTPEQVQRIRVLGGQISANVYYLHELSDVYANKGIGYERASQMARLGSCFREGLTTTIHSDFTMAPAEPLNSAWVAVNRMNHAGEVMCDEEKITPYQALQAITINAAQVLGWADETGSLRAGKFADFTVLEDNPLTINPEALRDIDIHATVFEGCVFES